MEKLLYVLSDSKRKMMGHKHYDLYRCCKSKIKPKLQYVQVCIVFSLWSQWWVVEMFVEANQIHQHALNASILKF